MKCLIFLNQKIKILAVNASEGNLDDIKKKFPKVRWVYFKNNTHKAKG